MRVPSGSVVQPAVDQFARRSTESLIRNSAVSYDRAGCPLLLRILAETRHHRPSSEPSPPVVRIEHVTGRDVAPRILRHSSSSRPLASTTKGLQQILDLLGLRPACRTQLELFFAVNVQHCMVMFASHGSGLPISAR